uniref:Ring finger protein 187 n=1 Tax=Mustela putorius furo TaxID=9669 RepID=M3XPS5_MUSPF
MRKDLKDARDLHGQAESAAAVWKGHVMDRRKKALTDYRKLRAFFAEEEERFLQEAEKEDGSMEDEDADPADRFGSLLQVVSELERRHRSLGLSMLLQVGSPGGGWPHPSCLAPARGCTVGIMDLGDPGLHTPSHLRAGLAAPVPPSSGPPGAILIL